MFAVNLCVICASGLQILFGECSRIGGFIAGFKKTYRNLTISCGQSEHAKETIKHSMLQRHTVLFIIYNFKR